MPSCYKCVPPVMYGSHVALARHIEEVHEGLKAPEEPKVKEMRITVALEGLKSAALQFDPHKPDSLRNLHYAADLYRRVNK